MLLTIAVFVVLLLVLVLVHEFGHFVAAKAAGCAVSEFAFGFPPRLFSITRGETRYSFNLIPLGGYVKIEGENMDEAAPGPRSFANQPAWRRIGILCAGVFMNMLLAVVLLSVQAAGGVPTVVTDENEGTLRNMHTFIVTVEPGSPGAIAGLQPLDRIAAVGEISRPKIDDVQQLLLERAGGEVPLQIERNGLPTTVTVVPRENPPPGEGAVGIGLQALGLERTPWWRAPAAGVARTGRITAAIYHQFGEIIHQLFTRGTVENTLTGPVGIALYTNEVTRMGLSYVLEFAALISINLALVNSAPFPALDGGRVLFVIIETIAGRRLPRQAERWAHTAGFAVLIVLMVLITVKDIRHFLL
ncbi:MAG: RIP metalloprotease RseP [Candidatus Andersenbacteria bacterium CG10_big_fil_rev_8_21_14_0_10_54_11]|uniref:RIP metalloprotease RseP n=1 Tax=Candidatus Andersenbacteria bacterium CG10_big_fil_rev_8_21_14_0_10_54_11 TaxID=1974485 RepID=A0A2M6WYH2_9BACT|nr:MAG: RIP metalloprotease RseP [Candidatus Andersenbacteria bacterium CG10_big_fil_rev_8_21_14_0_10_54_11]